MKAVKSLKDVLDFITDSDFGEETGSGIIKFLAAMKTGWVDAGKAAGGSSNIITKAFSSIGAGISSLGILSKIGLVIAAVAAVVAVIDGLTVSASEANDKMAFAFDAYTESKDKVASINSELETAQQRINELETHGGLTLVEQSELERLRESTELLRIQQDIAEKNQARAAKESAKAAVEAYNKNFKHGISDSDTKWWSEYYGSSGSHQDEMIRASSYRRSSVPDTRPDIVSIG